MSDKSFLSPPVRLSQAFENDHSGGGGITRRTFIKRTGGATVATMVAWNLTVNEARAEGGSEGSGSCSASFMCAISPVNLDGAPGNVVGYCSFPGGGYIFLYHKDNDCCAEKSDNHHAVTIHSTSQIYANAWVPAKINTTPWVLHPDADGNEPNEVNRFDIGDNGITRTNTKEISIRVSSRDLGEIPPGDSLVLKLEIKSVNRTNCSVEIFAKSWLEGTAGGVTYNSGSFAEGSGISMVIENNQDPHGYDDCDVAL